MTATNNQWAPYPTALADLVEAVEYRPGWKLWLEDMQRDQDHGRGTAGGLTLVIRTETANSYNWHLCDACRSVVTGYRVHHYFSVPAATYDERSWRRWLFERLVDVERHESAEFFAVDGTRPYAPSHGPGNDPYMIREVGTELDQRTRFTGQVA